MEREDIFTEHGFYKHSDRIEVEWEILVENFSFKTKYLSEIFSSTNIIFKDDLVLSSNTDYWVYSFYLKINRDNKNVYINSNAIDYFKKLKGKEDILNSIEAILNEIGWIRNGTGLNLEDGYFNASVASFVKSIAGDMVSTKPLDKPTGNIYYDITKFNI